MNNLLSEQDTKTLLDLLVEQLDVTVAQLTPEAKLEEDLNADSLTKTEIAMAVEDRFNVSIPDEEWEKVTTVGELFELLSDQLGKFAPGQS
jgi:acyl carrier protein